MPFSLRTYVLTANVHLRRFLYFSQARASFGQISREPKRLIQTKRRMCQNFHKIAVNPVDLTVKI